MTTQLESLGPSVKGDSLRAMMSDIMGPVIAAGVELVNGVRVFTYLHRRLTARSLTEELRKQYPVLNGFEYISVLTEVNRIAKRAFGATKVQPPRTQGGKGAVRDLARAELKKRIAAMSNAELAKLAK